MFYVLFGGCILLLILFIIAAVTVIPNRNVSTNEFIEHPYIADIKNQRVSQAYQRLSSDVKAEFNDKSEFKKRVAEPLAETLSIYDCSVDSVEVVAETYTSYVYECSGLNQQFWLGFGALDNGDAPESISRRCPIQHEELKECL